METKLKKLSDFCIEIRKKTGLSQNAFAKQNNISHTKVNKIENGDFDNDPSPIVLARIAEVYGFDINDSFRYGIKIDEDYLKKLNSYRMLEHIGTPALTGNELLDTFTRTYIRVEHSSDDNWNILHNENNRSYFELELVENKYSFHGYVYCIKEVSTINSKKDELTIDNQLSKIILSSLTETNNTNKDYKVILIVTGSEKIFKYILKKYKNKIYNTKFIAYRLYYCSYGKYKNNVIDDYLNESDFVDWIKTLPNKK